MPQPQRPPPGLELPNTLVEARQRIADLADHVRTEKHAGALRAHCLELTTLATTVVAGLDRIAKAAPADWPRDLNTPEADPAWGLDPVAVRRD